VTFGKITCSELGVVNEKGNENVRLSTNENGGIVGVRGKDGKSSGLRIR